MYYNNTLKVTMKNNTVANKALEILRSRLAEGFSDDNGYRTKPSQMMSDALEVVDNTIVLPEDFGCYITEDAENVMFELIRHLAENIGNDSFVWNGWDCNDYSEANVEAEYAQGLLNIKYTYYPSGAGTTVWCAECDEEIIHMDDFEEGKTYVCPECGEVIDMTEYAPVVTEKTIQII